MKICKLLLAIVFCLFGKVIRNQAHQHDEAFYNLVESVTGTQSHTLDNEAVQALFQTLEKRFHMENEQCFDQIQNHLKLTGYEEYNETTFFEASKSALNYLVTGNCSIEGNQNNPVFNESKLCKHDLHDLIRELEKDYEVFSTEICFNENTLISGNCTFENMEVVYEILLNLYEGNCILPESFSVINGLFEHIGVEGDVVTDESYFILLSDLRIGPKSSSNEEEDHDHESDDTQPPAIGPPRKSRNEDDYNHDHDHHDDHDHEHTIPGPCYTDYQLRSIFGYYDNMTRNQVLSMCPVFLQQIIEGGCSTTQSASENNEAPYYTTAMKYGYGTVAVTILSLLALLALVFFPVIGSRKFQLTMQFFMALGVGTMSGDAIFHIIPEVVGIHSHGPGDDHDDDHDHEEGVADYVWKLVVIVAAIWAMFLFESVLRLFPSPHKYKEDNSIQSGIKFGNYPRKNNEDSQSVTGIKINKSIVCGSDVPTSKETTNIKMTSFSNNDPGIGRENLAYVADEESVEKKSNSDQPEENSFQKTYFFGITATGIMVFIGDIFHNFGDGIAIGAAFSVSWPQGVGTSFAIAFHELPHEFGDFAIYMNNGLSKYKALLINFTAACCCYIGLYVGLALSEDPGVRIWLLSFVGGMFLYISLINVLHEMVRCKTKNPKLQFVLQNSGLFIGWLILFLLTIYEEQLINSF